MKYNISIIKVKERCVYAKHLGDELMVDVIIIGAGPAGLSACLYASRAKLETIIIDPFYGGQLMNTETIDNYLGLPNQNAMELADIMYEHALGFGAKHVMATIGDVKYSNNTYEVITTKGESYFSKTLIVATGTTHNKLLPEIDDSDLPISYCAVCDAPFYQDKKVTVIGSGDSALEATALLSDIASDVNLLIRSEHFKGKPESVDLIARKPNVRVRNLCEVIDMTPVDEGKIKLTILDKDSNEVFDEVVEGLFPNIGSVTNIGFMQNIFSNLKDWQHYDLRFNNNVSNMGLYLAGDVIPRFNRQVAIAVGEGADMALKAYNFLLDK
mgnify:CR=1 FL=1